MSIEAMRLALDALTRIWEDGLENFPESAHDAAITALRTAIEQAEKQEPVAYMGTDIDGNPNKFRLNSFGGSIPLYTKTTGGEA